MPPFSSGMVRPRRPVCLERLEDVLRVLAALVDLLRARRDDFAGDAARGVLDQAMFFGEFELHGVLQVCVRG